jgi:hypothetical protein
MQTLSPQVVRGGEHREASNGEAKLRAARSGQTTLQRSIRTGAQYALRIFARRFASGALV